VKLQGEEKYDWMINISYQYTLSWWRQLHAYLTWNQNLGLVIL